MQEKWKDKMVYGDRWLVEIVISAFKGLLEEAVRTVKPEHILVYVAIQMAVYNRTWDIIIEAVGR